VIPNGEIRTLANRSKDFSYYVIDLGIDYEDDVDAAGIAAPGPAGRGDDA
jgi:hypothetical protein